MRYSIPLLALLLLVRLTDLEGFDMFVAQDAVVWVGKSRACGADAHAMISTVSGQSICVAEDVVDVVKKLRQASN